MNKQPKLLAALERAYRKKPTPVLLAKIQAIKYRENIAKWLAQ